MIIQRGRRHATYQHCVSDTSLLQKSKLYDIGFVKFEKFVKSFVCFNSNSPLSFSCSFCKSRTSAHKNFPRSDSVVYCTFDRYCLMYAIHAQAVLFHLWKLYGNIVPYIKEFVLRRTLVRQGTSKLRNYRGAFNSLHCVTLPNDFYYFLNCSGSELSIILNAHCVKSYFRLSLISQDRSNEKIRVPSCFFVSSVLIWLLFVWFQLRIASDMSHTAGRTVFQQWFRMLLWKPQSYILWHVQWLFTVW